MKRFIKRTGVSLFIILFVLNIGMLVLAKEASGTGQRIIGIDDLTVFDETKDSWYVYFGRPTCVECVKFEPYLVTILEETDTIVYYFNTAYWKEDARYEEVLNRYQIDVVPTVVKIKDGEMVSTVGYASEDTGEELKERLKAFFSEDQSTRKNSYPVQFTETWMSMIVLLLVIQLLSLLYLERKKVFHKGFLALQMAMAVVLLGFSFLLSEYGKSYAVYFEAVPANGWVAALGKWAYPDFIIMLVILIILLAGGLLFFHTKTTRRGGR